MVHRTYVSCRLSENTVVWCPNFKTGYVDWISKVQKVQPSYVYGWSYHKLLIWE